MQTSASLEAACPPADLFRHVSTLDRYPAWMTLVHAAIPESDGEAHRPAWAVELRTRIGPLARSKRLRMVRTEFEPDRLVVFERAEVDGRRHADWVLRVDLDPAGDTTRLTMHLSYGGSLWTGGVLQHVLDAEIERGRDRLLALVNGGGDPASPTR